MDSLFSSFGDLKAMGIDDDLQASPGEDIDIGTDQGEDFEDDVDAELAREDAERAIRGEDDDFDGADTPAGRSERSGALFGSDEEDSGFEDEDDDEVDEYDEVRALYPGFNPEAVLNLTDVFEPPPRKRARLSADALRCAETRGSSSLTAAVDLPPPASIPFARSTRNLLPSAHAASRGLVASLIEQSRRSMREERVEPRGVRVEDELARFADEATTSGWELPPDEALTAIDLDDWDGRVDRPVALPPTIERSSALPKRNALLDRGDWTSSIIWDDRAPFTDFSRLQLSSADVVEIRDDDGAGPGARAKRQRGADLDPLNMSNDKQYEVARERRQRVRQTLGALEVQHAYPAVKLQMPFYRTGLTKAMARAHHRKPVSFPVGVRFAFSRVRGAKRRKDKAGKRATIGEEAMRTSGDLSLRDSSPFIMLEYSEEYPSVLVNFGMGSVIANYYRRRDPQNKEELPPPAELGETKILEPTDESPFKRFGEIQPGQLVATVYNNLVRAPVFQHKPPATDFVVVRNTTDGEARYYIREIKSLCAVGQLFPVEEVPMPKARKTTALMRHRLQLIALRLCARNGGFIRVPKIVRYFNDQTDLQMRQRLKEFMEYSRRQDASGSWSIKPTVPLNETELRRLATPELVVLSEAMEAGRQYLVDAGFNATTGADEDEAGNDQVSWLTEEKLAPWRASKNFLLAQTGKAMLALHGDGDPTGRGEAFDLCRVNMKTAHKPAHIGDKKFTVAEQQKVYRAEIDRIWRAQLRSLADPREPVVTAEDEARLRAAEEREQATPAADSPSAAAAAGGEGGTAAEERIGKNKIVRIRRFVNGQWETKIIRDPLVVAAYVAERREIDKDQPLLPEDLQPGDDPVKNAEQRERIEQRIKLLRQKAEQRNYREQARAGTLPDGAQAPPGAKKVKVETTRKCGNCGAIGHMKTNAACPRFAEFFPEKAKKREEEKAAKQAARAAARPPKPPKPPKPVKVPKAPKAPKEKPAPKPKAPKLKIPARAPAPPSAGSPSTGIKLKFSLGAPKPPQM